MSFQSFMFNIGAAKNDKKRDAAIPIPQGVTACRDISYGKAGKWHKLDVYFPEGAQGRLPTIVSVHGGGYVYGNKEIYLRYCMDLARRGFAVVNFNYRLAPKWRFPAPLEDTNAVMEWICGHEEMYHLDSGCIFLIGDSAGAQIASQYAAIWSNPEYAGLFGFTVPSIHIRALGLNCGLYEIRDMIRSPRKGLAKDYIAKDTADDDPRFTVVDAIRDDYPPAYIVTAYHDFLRDNAEPMCRLLKERGVRAVCRQFGSEDREDIAHVFHVNIALNEATECNDSQCAFFKEYI